MFEHTNSIEMPRGTTAHFHSNAPGEVSAPGTIAAVW
jgi:hypothetical protein